MTRITIDRETLKRLGGLSDVLELCDESGRRLGVFRPEEYRNPIDGSPFTEEELQERVKTRTGRDVSEVLKTLEAL